METALVKFLLLFVIVASLKPIEGCSSYEVKCPAGHKCIHVNWICDVGNDCGDNSDEAYCKETRPISCPVENFQCSNRSCIARSAFCDGVNDCGDRSDEFYCNLERSTRCPPFWWRCNDTRRCIQENWKCDEFDDCYDGSDESERECGDKNLPLPLRKVMRIAATASDRTVEWLLSRRKTALSTARWGEELHRLATALYLVDSSYFTAGNRTGEEMAYELTIQLLYKLSGNIMLRNEELALFVQALSITCIDPRNFFGHDLVSELRKRVEESKYTNPFEILVLCNAGDVMTSTDVSRVYEGFGAQHRPLWTDTQAIATLALQCMSSQNVSLDESMIFEMQDDLKKRQFENGTVGNLMTTALVVQALLYNESYRENFDTAAAVTSLMKSQKTDGSWSSVLDSYYVLPVFNFKSLANISPSHCILQEDNDQDAPNSIQIIRGEKFTVQYSVWMETDLDLRRTWKLRIPASRSNSIYDVIETLKKLDSRHNVKYNVVDGKPYVSSLYGKEDDPELGMYWFIYVHSLLFPDAPRLVEASPADVKVLPNQEIILWYKPGSWSESETMKYFAQRIPK